MSSYTSKKRRENLLLERGKKEKEGGRKGGREGEKEGGMKAMTERREGTNYFLLDSVKVTKPQTPYSENWQLKERIKYISCLS